MKRRNMIWNSFLGFLGLNILPAEEILAAIVQEEKGPFGMPLEKIIEGDITNVAEKRISFSALPYCDNEDELRLLMQTLQYSARDEFLNKKYSELPWTDGRLFPDITTGKQSFTLEEI